MKNKYWALKLTGSLVLIFIIQLIFKGFTDLFVLDSSKVFIHPWTLITSIFLHANLTHLMLNGFALALFGSLLENIIGSRKFLYLFFISGIVANIPGAVFYNSSLGASGAIFGLLGTLTVLRPRMVIWLNFMPVPMWLAAIIWALQDIFGILVPSDVANWAHLGGLFFGMVYGFYLRREDRFKRPYSGLKEDLALKDEEIEDWENKWFKIKP